METISEANEKARLRRQMRQNKILGHESERLSKIIGVAHSKSFSDIEKPNTSNEIPIKMKNHKNQFFESQIKNESKKTEFSEEECHYQESSSDKLLIPEKDLTYLFKDCSEPAFNSPMLFLKNIFFSLLKNEFSEECQSPTLPTKPVESTIITNNERWWKLAHFIWMMVLVFKVILEHIGFSGTTEDRLAYNISKPFFYYFMMSGWILYVTQYLFNRGSINEPVHPLLKMYIPLSIQPYFRLLFRCHNLCKQSILDVCLFVFTLGILSWWNHLNVFKI